MEEKIGFQEWLFGPRYRFLVGGGGRVDTQGASNQFDHLLVVVKHLEPLLGIEGVAEHLDVALLQPILGVEELQPILSVTGKQHGPARKRG